MEIKSETAASKHVLIAIGFSLEKDSYAPNIFVGSLLVKEWITVLVLPSSIAS